MKVANIKEIGEGQYAYMSAGNTGDSEEDQHLFKKEQDCVYFCGIIFNEATAEAICRLFNNQSKYIVPMKNRGGGFIRKLTKAEVKRQAQLQREAWGLKDEDAGGK